MKVEASLPDAAGPALPVDEAPLAWLFGQPVTAMPQDLYIPPDALRVMLDRFEGPLDLLLYLIRKQNLDILDIPMATVTVQYMAYVEAMSASQFELAGEYLLMAALLIEIKSRMLLPRPVLADTEEGQDPRAELVRRLIEYEQMKLAAGLLDRLPLAGRDFSWAVAGLEHDGAALLPVVAAPDLALAWQAILARARNTQHHQVAPEGLSVRARMVEMLRSLHADRATEFSALFDPEGGVPMLVVSFLALLELTKEGLVTVTQITPYALIHVQLAGAGRSSGRKLAEPELEPT